jgi:hypothetical protein
MNHQNTDLQMQSEKNIASAFWLILGALFAMLAAYYAFDHEGRAGIRSGSLALVAYIVALVHMANHKKALALGPKSNSWTLHLMGASLLCVAFALTAALTLKSYRGLYLVGTFFLHKEGAIQMAWLFAVIFAVGALLAKLFAQRLNHSVRLFALIGTGILLVAFMAGPLLVVEVIDYRQDVDQRVKYTQRSIW